MLPSWHIMSQDKASSVLPPVQCPYLLHNYQDLMTQARHNSHKILNFYQNTMTSTNVWPCQTEWESTCLHSTALSQHQFKIIVRHYSPAPHYKPYFTESHFRQKLPTLVGNEGRKTGQEVSLCVGYLTRRRALETIIYWWIVVPHGGA